MNSQIIPLLGVASPSFTPEPLRTITVNATFEGEQTTVYKEAVILDSTSTREALVQFPLRDGKHSSRTFAASAIDDPDKNRVIMLYGSSPEDQAVVSKSLKITSDLNILLDLSENGGGIVDYPLLTGIGKLSGFFDLSSLPDTVDYSQITIVANYKDPLEGVYNGLQAGKTTCNPDGSWAIEGLNEEHRYNVVMSIPTFNDITYSNKETSDSTYVPEGDPHWDKVVALLHFDGDVTDAKGNSWTLSGNTRFIPSPALGFGSAIEFYNKTVNDYIAVTPDSRFDFGSGDITIELMVDARDMSPNGATSMFIGSWTEGGKAGANWYLAAVSRKLVFSANGIVTLTSSANLPLNMVHIAYTRSGNTHRLFIGGVKVAESVAAGAIPHTSHPIRIGRWDASNGWFDGVIDELRITKGVARYTENFTPPTKPFPNYLPR